MRTSATILACTCLLTASIPAQDAPQRPRSRTLVLKVGTIHPVSGPAIENGVIVVRAGRIFNVGAEGAVRIPRRATVLSFPKAHVYPGLVDAMSNAFTSRQSNSNRSTNAGTDFLDALDPTHDSSRDLVDFGITTAYVGNQSVTTWRGLGAIIRPDTDGFDTIEGHRHGGTALRMTTGFGADHALDRLKRFDKTGNVFDALEAYEKQQADYAKALADYEKKREAWLAYHAEKNASKAPAKPAAKTPPAGKPATGPEKAPAKPAPTGDTRKTGTGTTPPTERPARGSRRGAEGAGRRGGMRRGGSTRGRRPGTTPTRGRPASGTDPKAPEKPKYPKKVKKDPAKEALLAVVNGKLPLRVEVHRKDEILAALFMAVAKELPGITLEGATEAGDLAEDIARAGATVIVTDLLPGADPYTRTRDGSLPGKLHAAGVKVAIASGNMGNARNLTMMAAYAAGRGMPVDAAVRALTLTPAEILGISDKVGSIEKNKFADLVITSGPLLASDSRILRVLSQGETKYEAK